MICATACALPYAARSAHMSCTSPPYYQKRRYLGVSPTEWPAVSYSPMAGLPAIEVPAVTPAVLVETPDAGILGLEPDPFAYIGHLVTIAREVRRVLRDDGIFCVNIGDSYCGSRCGPQGETGQRSDRWFTYERSSSNVSPGLKPKDLMLIPARLAMALQADGWYLRSRMPGGVEDGSQIGLRPDVIWSKNAMPESVRDRPSVDFEDVFIFSKSKRYCWDQENGRTEAEARPLSSWAERSEIEPSRRGDPGESGHVTRTATLASRAGANMRASWRINTEPTSEEHYAAWPRELVRRLTTIGTSDKGCCPECGAQWRRIVDRAPAGVRRDNGSGDALVDLGMYSGRAGEVATRTICWSQSCSCAPADPVPCSVLDPFSGIGRTGEVCFELGRRYMPAEISIGYAAIQHRRLADHRTVARGEALRPVVPRTITGPLFAEAAT